MEVVVVDRIQESRLTNSLGSFFMSDTIVYYTGYTNDEGRGQMCPLGIGSGQG